MTHLAFGAQGDPLDPKEKRRGSQVKYSRFTTKGDIVLAVGLATGDIKIYDMADPGQYDASLWLARYLTLKQHDFCTGRMALYLQDHTDSINSLRFSPDGR